MSRFRQVKKTDVWSRMTMIFGAAFLCSALFSMPAQAGFEWTPPRAVKTAPAPAPQNSVAILEEPMPAVPPVPVSATPIEVLTPDPAMITQPVAAPPSVGMKTLPAQPSQAALVKETPAKETLVKDPVSNLPEAFAPAPVTTPKAPTRIARLREEDRKESQIEPKTEPLYHRERPPSLPSAAAPTQKAETVDRPKTEPSLSDLLLASPTNLARKPKAAPTSIASVEKSPLADTPNVARASISSSERIPEGRVEGFGKDIPLAVALGQIVPASYAFHFSDARLAGTRISWDGGQDWQSVLQGSLQAVGLTAQIFDRSISIQPRGQDVASIPPVATKTVATKTTAKTDKKPDSFVPVFEAAPKPRPTLQAKAVPPTARNLVFQQGQEGIWQARPGMTLREALEDWGRLAGFEVEWSTAYDYPIRHAFRYQGTIEKAIDTALSSSGGGGDNLPRPRGKLHPNLPNGPSVLIVR